MQDLDRVSSNEESSDGAKKPDKSNTVTTVTDLKMKGRSARDRGLTSLARGPESSAAAVSGSRASSATTLAAKM